ncbi:hypothetical protein NADFUDRAFT_51566 [Nadsonia fulvescens var. elongata DSM 6958]|uniref:Uncharacterized protein n=1 Tax=Nadsonia fulvescens var. elongata DSM 6958 TaxID=857566 RepID=A0A1E3PJE4_9ASCO|nr:hypothetical protein NADFUDRAFT_51566 [Nadsonia fulvescens var. elongata DSM 6958]
MSINDLDRYPVHLTTVSRLTVSKIMEMKPRMQEEPGSPMFQTESHEEHPRDLKRTSTFSKRLSGAASIKSFFSHLSVSDGQLDTSSNTSMTATPSMSPSLTPLASPTSSTSSRFRLKAPKLRRKKPTPNSQSSPLSISSSSFIKSPSTTSPITWTDEDGLTQPRTPNTTTSTTSVITTATAYSPKITTPVVSSFKSGIENRFTPPYRSPTDSLTSSRLSVHSNSPNVKPQVLTPNERTSSRWQDSYHGLSSVAPLNHQSRFVVDKENYSDINDPSPDTNTGTDINGYSPTASASQTDSDMDQLIQSLTMRIDHLDQQNKILMASLKELEARDEIRDQNDVARESLRSFKQFHQHTTKLADRRIDFLTQQNQHLVHLLAATTELVQAKNSPKKQKETKEIIEIKTIPPKRSTSVSVRHGDTETLARRYHHPRRLTADLIEADPKTATAHTAMTTVPTTDTKATLATITLTPKISQKVSAEEVFSWESPTTITPNPVPKSLISNAPTIAKKPAETKTVEVIRSTPAIPPRHRPTSSLSSLMSTHTTYSTFSHRRDLSISSCGMVNSDRPRKRRNHAHRTVRIGVIKTLLPVVTSVRPEIAR